MGSGEGTTYDSNVTINGTDALVGASLGQLRRNHLFNGQDDTLVAADADGCAAILYRLDGVFDLEVAAIGREDGVEQIVPGSYRGLRKGKQQLALYSRRAKWEISDRLGAELRALTIFALIEEAWVR